MVQRFASQWPEWQAKQNASFPVGRIGRAEEGERVSLCARSARQSAHSSPPPSLPPLTLLSMAIAQLRIQWSSFSLPLAQ
eukprot:4658708-Prymnesium_polylepis.1